MQADIKRIAELMNESAEEKKKLAEEAKKQLEELKAEAEDIDEKEDDEKLNEAVPTTRCDAQYVAKAKKLLAGLQKTNPDAYAMAMKYLEMHKDQMLVTPEEFAARRIKLASEVPAEEPEMSTDDRRAAALDRTAKAWQDFEASQKAADAEVKANQPISQIWVRSLTKHGVWNQVTLVITYKDGKNEVKKMNVDISPADRYYKEVERALKGAQQEAAKIEYKAARKAGVPASEIEMPKIEVTKEDVFLAMLHVAYKDWPNIKWVYGPSKVPSVDWIHDESVKLALKQKAEWTKAAKKNAKVNIFDEIDA